MIGRWLGAAALGHYARAQRLASLRGAPGAVLARVLFPSMARRQHRAERLAEIWLHGTEIMSLLALQAAILLALAAPEIVAVVLGGQWQAAVPVLQIFTLAAPFRFCDAVNRPPPRALGAAWRQAAQATLLVSAVWAGSRWGLAGGAAGAACAQAAAYLLTSQLALKLLGERWGRLARCHCPALWAGAWVGPALGLSAVLARKAELPVAAALGAEILACGAAASLAVWYAPGFARPAFPGWALATLRFDAVGRPWRWRHLRDGTAGEGERGAVNADWRPREEGPVTVVFGTAGYRNPSRGGSSTLARPGVGTTASSVSTARCWTRCAGPARPNGPSTSTSSCPTCDERLRRHGAGGAAQGFDPASRPALSPACRYRLRLHSQRRRRVLAPRPAPLADAPVRLRSAAVAGDGVSARALPPPPLHGLRRLFPLSRQRAHSGVLRAG